MSEHPICARCCQPIQPGSECAMFLRADDDALEEARIVRGEDVLMTHDECPDPKPISWVSEDRCVWVSMWTDGVMRVARRDHPSDIWPVGIIVKREEQ